MAVCTKEMYSVHVPVDLEEEEEEEDLCLDRKTSQPGAVAMSSEALKEIMIQELSDTVIDNSS